MTRKSVKRITPIDAFAASVLAQSQRSRRQLLYREHLQPLNSSFSPAGRKLLASMLRSGNTSRRGMRSGAAQVVAAK